MIQEVHWREATYALPPLRFEAGTPLIAPAIGLKAALEWIEQATIHGLHAHVQTLAQLAEQRLQRIPGLRILGTAPQKGPLVTFFIEGTHPLDIAYFLDAREIAIRSGHLCAQPTLRKFGLTAALRASFGAYNTLEEVERLASALEEAIHLCANLPKQSEKLADGRD